MNRQWLQRSKSGAGSGLSARPAASMWKTQAALLVRLTHPA
jgi:hypothetical protein